MIKFIKNIRNKIIELFTNKSNRYNPIYGIPKGKKNKQKAWNETY